MPTFEATRKGYANLWNQCVVREDKLAASLQLAEKLSEYKPRYDQVEAETGVPWWWIGPTAERESSNNFKTHLHNGDPLTARTKHVPKGRPPPPAQPPFTWEQSAIDALTLKELQKIESWTIERALFEWERYNGWGYYNKNVNSPYVWSWTNLQQPGKYVADGKWSKTAMDIQPGCAAMLRELIFFDGLDLPREAVS